MSSLDGSFSRQWRLRPPTRNSDRSTGRFIAFSTRHRKEQKMTASEVPEYSELPARAAKLLADLLPDETKIAARVAQFADVEPRPLDKDGDTEVLDGVTFTHHFVDAPGDEETVRFHFVEAGDGEP